MARRNQGSESLPATMPSTTNAATTAMVALPTTPCPSRTRLTVSVASPMFLRKSPQVTGIAPNHSRGRPPPPSARVCYDRRVPQGDKRGTIRGVTDPLVSDSAYFQLRGVGLQVIAG